METRSEDPEVASDRLHYLKNLQKEKFNSRTRGFSVLNEGDVFRIQRIKEFQRKGFVVEKTKSPRSYFLTHLTEYIEDIENTCWEWTNHLNPKSRI